MTKEFLSIKNFSVAVKETHKKIVNQVSFQVPKGKIVALVGGSGSGKTTIGLSLMGLLSPALDVVSGEINLEGRNLRALTSSQWQKIRGREVAMVFQEPLYAFNPIFRIGEQIEEVLTVHFSLEKKERRQKVLDLLKQIEISDPERIYNSYPHQLSGGLRQRAMIAQSIAGEPSLIIADEPTSNLDVTIQARIMDVFRVLKDRRNMSILLITHDLGIVEHLADQVVVLSEGRVVEQGDIKAVMETPREDFTKQLIKAFH